MKANGRISKNNLEKRSQIEEKNLVCVIHRYCQALAESNALAIN